MSFPVEKTPYFTADSLHERSREMLGQVEALRARHQLRLFPYRSALLILDMQRYFLDESSHAHVPSARAIVPGIARLAEAYSKRGLPIVLTRHVNSESDAGMMAQWWRDLIRADSPLSEIIPEVQGFGTVIEKSQYDAFYGTQLEDTLHRQGVKQLIICGVMTHLCCETTARSAFVRGFEVFFTVDGTAAYNEAFHRATLLNLSHGFAVPVLIDEVFVRCD